MNLTKNRGEAEKEKEKRKKRKDEKREGLRKEKREKGGKYRQHFLLLEFRVKVTFIGLHGFDEGLKTSG